MSDTHFGFETVKAEEKSHRVGEVFADIAQKYDLLNDLSSLFLHRYWKRVAVARARLPQNARVLDLAGGTGDLTQRIMAKIPSATVILSDINDAMLKAGEEKLKRLRVFPPLLQCDAQALPFDDATFDAVFIGFGLRNVTDKLVALKEMRRVLKANGQAVILEFSRASKAFKPFYDWYSFAVLPKLGKWFAGNEAGYRYLVESIRMHPDQETLAAMMKEAGFSRVSYTNLTAGVVALHVGLTENAPCVTHALC